MEKIKKELKRKLTTGSTGNVGEYTIIVDTSVNYDFKFLLKKTLKNIGNFKTI